MNNIVGVMTDVNNTMSVDGLLNIFGILITTVFVLHFFLYK